MLARMKGPTSSDLPFDRDLVRARMRETKVTQTDLADALGFTSQSAISNILAGVRGVKVEEAAAIYSFLGLRQQPQVRQVPIIGWTSAGNWREAVRHAIGRMPVANKVAGPKSFAVEVQGDSMDRIIPEGGFVVVDPDQVQPVNGKIYLIENDEHESQVKMYRTGPARYEPVSSNDSHKAVAAGEAVKVIGRVVWQGSPL